jgi:predicted transcriptional regulator YdeE
MFAGGEDRVSAPVVRKIDGFTVIGITARTNNAREMTADGLIGKQWDRLFKEGILNKIPNKADSNIIAIYTAYASDHDGDYTYVLGAKVSPGAETPTGMVAVKVQPGKYAMFTSDRGIVTKVVPETWQRINSLPKSAVGGDRVYKTDFEVYDQRAADPQNSQMDVYIGIR